MAETHRLSFNLSLQVLDVRSIYRRALLCGKNLNARKASLPRGACARAGWIVVCFCALGGEAGAVPELTPEGSNASPTESATFERIDALLREVGNPQALVGSTSPTPGGALQSVPASLSPDAGVTTPGAANGPQSSPPNTPSTEEAVMPSPALESMQLASGPTDEPKTEVSQKSTEEHPSPGYSPGLVPNHPAQAPSRFGNDGVSQGAVSSAVSSGADTNGIFTEILSGSKTDGRDFTKLLLSVLGALLGVTLIAWHLVKSRETRESSATKSVRALQLSATLPLGPKRQILLVRVRDTELALASTEHGISLLGEVGNSNRSAVASQLITSPVASTPAVERAHAPIALPVPETRQIAPEPPRSQVAGKKSEILRKALETIESRKKGDSGGFESKAPTARRSSSGTEDLRQERPVSQDMGLGERQKTQANASRSTLPPGPEAQRFKKFFTNSYKSQNTERQEQKASNQANAGQEIDRVVTSIESENQTDNVAQLIREKLKQMRTIS